LVITSTEDVASVHGSFPSALCNEDRPIREVGAGVARLCAVSQLTTGYRGNRNWRDTSEYAVHFTKIDAKIERALERGTDRRVPIVRAVRRAYTLATEYPRRNLVIALERQRRRRRR
jgi:hypothetical protein